MEPIKVENRGGARPGAGRPPKVLNFTMQKEVLRISLDTYEDIQSFLNFAKNSVTSGEISSSQAKAMGYLSQVASRVINEKEELNEYRKKLKEYDIKLKVIEARLGPEDSESGDSSTNREETKAIKWKEPPTREDNEPSKLVRKYMERGEGRED